MTQIQQTHHNHQNKCRNHSSVTWPIALFFVFISLTNLSFALPEDRDKPIELTADLVEYDQKTGIATYTGNVVLVQGSMELNAQSATIYIEENVFTKVEAFGTPLTIFYLPEANKPPIEGEGNKLVYLPKTGTITINDNAKFKQGNNFFTSDAVEYNIQKSEIAAKGKQNEPVKFTIFPEKTN